MPLADLRYALRTLRRSPGFTALAVTSLALGIGANSAIFSLFDQFLLRPLPVRQSSELAIVTSPGDRPGFASSDMSGGPAWSYPMYKDIRDRNEVFAGLLARSMSSANISGQDGARIEPAELVSANYFEVLGVDAEIGRVLSPGDEARGDAVVLSHGYWRRALGGDPRVLNSTLRVNGHSMTVVGVAQRGFFGVQVGQEPAIFLPVDAMARFNDGNVLRDRQNHWLHMIGRLKPGVTRERAAAGLAPLVRGIREQESRDFNLPSKQALAYSASPVVLDSGAHGRQLVQDDLRGSLQIALILVGALLLIACANVAGLLLARGLNRQREIAVRLAIGASRWQVLRQLMVESMALAALAGIAALFVAEWTLRGLFKLMPSVSAVPGVEPSLDAPLFAVHAIIALGAGALLGLFPALGATRPALTPALKSETGAPRSLARQFLVGAQSAVTLALLAGAGFFAKSLLQLRGIDLGMRAEGVVRFDVGAKLSGYDTERTVQLFDRLRADLASLPGVTGVAVGNVPLFNNSVSGADFTVEGYTPAPNEDMEIHTTYVSPGYFSALGVPLVAGREFDAADRKGARSVCVINETAARSYFRNRDPIGQRIAFGTGNTKPNIEIVGVVKNSKHATIRERPARSAYFPYAQKESLGWGAFYVRTASDPQSLMQPIRSAVNALDPNLPVENLRTLSAHIDRGVLAERGLATVAIAFSAVAAVLAGIGLYGAMSLLVARRRREIGIRMALGARSEQVRWMVLREAGMIALGATAAGLPAAYALGRIAQAKLYRVPAWDPVTLGAATAAVAVVTLAAAWLPASEAVKVNPVEALTEGRSG